MYQAMGNISHGKTPEMLELGLSLSLGSIPAMSSNYLDAIRQAFLNTATSGQFVDPDRPPRRRSRR